MEEAGLSALLVYSKQWKAEVIHYVSNYRMLGEYAYCLIPIDAEPILYIAEPGDMQRAVSESWVKDIQVIAAEDPYLPIGDCMRFKGKIGVVGTENMDSSAYRTIADTLGDRATNAYSLVDNAAKTKSEWELKHIEIGGKLADMGFRAELAAARIGIKEFELAAEINYEMLANGADDNFQMFSAGKNLDCMHTPRENMLEEGDLILAEITPCIGSMNYASQLCRTTKVGTVTALEVEKYGLLATALEESLSIMKPGLPIREIALKQNEIIGAAGYEKYCHPPFMRVRGHNFGLGLIELTEDVEGVLLPGMAMVVHPNQYIPEIGYLACGETVYVTDTGIMRVNAMPAKLYEVEVSI